MSMDPGLIKRQLMGTHTDAVARSLHHLAALPQADDREASGASRLIRKVLLQPGVTCDRFLAFSGVFGCKAEDMAPDHVL